MPLRSRRCLLLSLPAVALLGLAVVMLWPRTSVINQVNADRIRPGMTLAEVEAILGGPSRDETSGAGIAMDDGTGSTIFLRGLPENKEWIGDVVVWVWFDREDRVVFHRTGSVYREPLTVRMRRWLHL